MLAEMIDAVGLMSGTIVFVLGAWMIRCDRARRRPRHDLDRMEREAYAAIARCPSPLYTYRGCAYCGVTPCGCGASGDAWGHADEPVYRRGDVHGSPTRPGWYATEVEAAAAWAQERRA